MTRLIFTLVLLMGLQVFACPLPQEVARLVEQLKIKEGMSCQVQGPLHAPDRVGNIGLLSCAYGRGDQTTLAMARANPGLLVEGYLGNFGRFPGSSTWLRVRFLAQLQDGVCAVVKYQGDILTRD